MYRSVYIARAQMKWNWIIKRPKYQMYLAFHHQYLNKENSVELHVVLTCHNLDTKSSRSNLYSSIGSMA